MKTSKIAVVGGGIGGLTVALALIKKGFSPIVFEKTAVSRPIGAGIVLSSNAMGALSHLGVLDKICGAGWPVKNFIVSTPEGNSLFEEDFAAIGKRFGYSAVGISRPVLHKILIDLLPKDCIKLGYNFESCNQTSEQVTLHFKEHTPIDADIVIGADGIHSKVRQAVLGKPPLRYSGQSGWRGLCRMPTHTPLLSFFESWGVGKRFGAVQVGPDLVYWYCGINAEANTLESNGVLSKNIISDLFSNWHAPIEELIEKTHPDSILQIDIFDMPPVKHWYSKKIVLLGDAIHSTTPNLGQGAGMAIESALALAHSLDTETTLDEAFYRYQMIRKNRTAWVTTQSWYWGKISQIENPKFCWLRNNALRLSDKMVPDFIKLSQFKKLMGHRIVF